MRSNKSIFYASHFNIPSKIIQFRYDINISIPVIVIN